MMRIRITVHGTVYTAMGVLLLISGLRRGELFSTGCGGMLILYAGFAAVAVAFTACYWKTEEPELKVDSGVFTVIPIRSGTAQGNPAKKFPFCIFGTAAFYVIEFSLSPDYTAETVENLFIPLQRMQTVYYPETMHRGRYFYKRQYLDIRDFAGFFAVSFMQPPCLSDAYTVVQPILPPKKAGFLNLHSRTAVNLPSQIRTDELYESRPYFVGDDPRKIHWKLYAHTQMLAIKLGAFEPPPVKHLTVYVEEPRCLKKKERALAAAALDTFISRLSGLIVQLLNAGIECSLLLYDYPRGSVQTSRAVGTNGLDAHPRYSKPQKSLQRYELPKEPSVAVALIQNLLAIPALRVSPEDIPDAAAVFNAVSDGGILYCYVPVRDELQAKAKTYAHPAERSGGVKGHTGEKIAVSKKIAAYRRSGVEAFFCIAAPLQYAMGRAYIHRLLYTSAASLRQEAFYRRLQKAAEQELRIFTAENCYAELL